MKSSFAFVCVAVFMVVTFRMCHITDGLAFRPFGVSTPSGLNCSSEQRLSDVGCPCTLPNIPCADETSVCIKRTCQFSAFTATPTISSYTIPCGLALRQPFPGLNISFAGAVGPVICSTDSVIYNSPQTVFVTSDFLDNDATDPFDPPYLSILFINTTGQVRSLVTVDPRNDPADPPVFISSVTAISIVLADPVNGYGATLDTQIYSGYCIDARGVRSNTFTFTVTITLCPEAMGPLFGP